ncbi:MAG: FeoA family protein [bacterium]
MKGALLPLSQISPGKEVTLVAIHGGKGLRARLTDMGLNEGMKFRVLHSYCSGPCIILIGNTRLVLGHGMTQKILVKEE